MNTESNMKLPEFTSMRKWASAKGKYTLELFYEESWQSYFIEHRVNGRTTGCASGIKTACDANNRVMQELELYALDGITLFEFED